MEVAQIKSKLMLQLKESGTANHPGAAIYSGMKTLKKGHIFFGLNPRSKQRDANSSGAFLSKTEDCEYCDGEWAWVVKNHVAALSYNEGFNIFWIIGW